MNTLDDINIPFFKPKTPAAADDGCQCSGKACAAVRHVEDVANELDQLRREVRQMERHHNEDVRRLWYKLGGLIVLLATVLPTGWASFLGLI